MTVRSTRMKTLTARAMVDFTVVYNEHNNPPESIEAHKLVLDLHIKPRGDTVSLPTKIQHNALLDCIHDVQYTLLENSVSDRAAPVTICHLMLKNGKNVLGINYGAINPNNHDETMGKEAAYKAAIDKLYELEGYSLINEHFKGNTGLLVDVEVEHEAW